MPSAPRDRILMLAAAAASLARARGEGRADASAHRATVSTDSGEVPLLALLLPVAFVAILFLAVGALYLKLVWSGDQRVAPKEEDVKARESLLDKTKRRILLERRL